MQFFYTFLFLYFLQFTPLLSVERSLQQLCWLHCGPCLLRHKKPSVVRMILSEPFLGKNLVAVLEMFM